MKIEYDVVISPTDHLVRDVNKKLAEDWKLQGGTSYCNGYYSQAVFRELKSDFTASSEEKDVINRGIKHGDEFECPTCGTLGQIDLNFKADVAEFPQSAWFNCHLQIWQCSNCYLK